MLLRGRVERKDVTIYGVSGLTTAQQAVHLLIVHLNFDYFNWMTLLNLRDLLFKITSMIMVNNIWVMFGEIVLKVKRTHRPECRKNVINLESWL